MRVIFLDFETTGLPLFDQPSDDPRQPHVVQAAAVLADSETRKAIASINLIARPDGWEIPDDVARIHGITTETALAVGVPEATVICALRDLWRAADLRCAHNEPFDARIMRIALKRFLGEAEAESWKAGKAECTQRLANPIMKLPPTAAMVAAGRKHSKAPNLGEAYHHFTGRKLEGAHSALVDVKACMDVWFAIKAVAQINAPIHAPPPAAVPEPTSADPFGLPPVADSDVPFLD